MHLPSNLEEIDTVIRDYAEMMEKGNALYKIISDSVDEINLTVEEVIEYSELQLYMPNAILAIRDAEHLEAQMYDLLNANATFCSVLIFPPDKAIALVADGGFVYVLDSHFHHMNGASISFCSRFKINEMCLYLEEFCNKYFNSSLRGSNLIPVSLFKL